MHFVYRLATICLALIVTGCSSSPAPQSETDSSSSDETLLLPAIGTTQQSIDRQFINVEVHQPRLDGIHIYVMHAADGSQAIIHLEYARNHRGALVVKTVKMGGSPLSSTWIHAFNKKYPLNPTRIPFSEVSASDQYSGTPTGNEQISFHTLSSLKSLGDGWYTKTNDINNNPIWKQGTCPHEPKTLVMKYSDDPKNDIEIYSEFLSECYPSET